MRIATAALTSRLLPVFALAVVLLLDVVARSRSWGVLVTGLLVLWRTRRLLYALSFVVPAVALTILGYTSSGLALGQAVTFAVGSSPILFLAAFMLSAVGTGVGLYAGRRITRDHF